MLAVSEKSLLPVLLTTQGVAKLPERLPDAIAEVLAFLEIPDEAIRGEIAAMKEGCTVAKTASRVVLGSMNDMADLTEVHLRSEHRLQTTRSPSPQAPSSQTVSSTRHDCAGFITSQNRDHGSEDGRLPSRV